VPGGARIFHRMYTRLGCQGRPPHFVVEFFPYANLMHTIRLREDAALVRLSDLLSKAPLYVQEAAAAILLARLYRRRPPRELLDAYRRFTMAHATRRRVVQMRRSRGRKLQSRPRGQVHDLSPMFTRLNRQYFSGRLRRPRLGWSGRAWRRQLGCFDPGVEQIVINIRLDRPEVPPFVVEYILYHEMLHVKHPIRAASCGLQSHSAAFRKEERRFRDYDRARRFLERLT
jgi:predicted metal-dependent hydrolase